MSVREFGPVDPYSIPRDELKAQCFAAMRGWWKPPDDLIPPGWFRCFVCARVLEGELNDRSLERMHQRFGDVPPEKQHIVCSDCNEIISGDLGLPE